MRRSIQLACAALVALLLGACASMEAETPAQRLFAAQSEFNIHQRIVIVYLSQPECAGPIFIGCARPDVKATLKIMVVRVRTALATAKATLAPGIMARYRDISARIRVMVEEGRDPTPDEWADLDAETDDLFRQIQDA